ncbi:MAG: hypothetical protein K0U68_02995 [Gammaproteobacteria bacterium]|nr:hypothetical protein [Gammaproteobacteria bacterium]
MKRYKILGLLVAFCLPVLGYAEQEAGDQEIIIAGSGTSSSGFDSTGVGVAVQYGMFATKEFEWGIRQNVAFADSNDGFEGNAATRVFGDYHFDLNSANLPNLKPFIGGSFGATYGSSVSESFIIGPEAGIKYYVLPKTFIVAQMSYQFNVRENAGDGETFYTIGMGFNF